MRNGFLLGSLFAIIALIAFIWGLTLIPGPAKRVLPPLPAHVLVMQQEKFLVAPGYETLGKVLCYDGEYYTKPGGKPFNGWYFLSCKGEDGTHNFRYPKSKEWSYADL